MNKELSHERSTKACFIWYLQLCLIIVKLRLQEPRALQRSKKENSFAKEVKEDLLNSAVLYCIPINEQKCSDRLPILVSSKLAER